MARKDTNINFNNPFEGMPRGFKVWPRLLEELNNDYSYSYIRKVVKYGMHRNLEIETAAKKLHKRILKEAG